MSDIPVNGHSGSHSGPRHARKKSDLRLDQLEKRLCYTFQNRSLLAGALHHPSGGGTDFQRLEFLGDRVLALVIAGWLFEAYPNEPEGLLAKRFVDLVKRESLLAVGQDLCLANFLRTDGPKKLPDRMIADSCEALLGAVYLDAGLEPAQRLIRTLWAPLLEGLEVPIDPKSALQETLQAQKRPLPLYRIAQRQGPSHNPWFLVELTLDAGGPHPIIYHGQGPSRRKAEQQAAQIAQKALQSDVKQGPNTSTQPVFSDLKTKT
jgi:ribonuclease III